MTTGFFSIGGSSGGGGSPSVDNSYATNYFTLTPTNITAKSVTLSQAPTTAGETALSVVGGASQEYGTAFMVSGSMLTWSGLSLDGVLQSGDQLVVLFPITV